jgi:hypothetical protein
VSNAGYPPPPPPPRPQRPQHASDGVDPRSAGLIRRERPGWALGFAGVGALASLAGLFLPRWVELWSSEGDVFSSSEEHLGLFDAVDRVQEVRVLDPEAPAPLGVAEAYLPWLLVALTVVCCVVAVVAALGLRRPALTGAVRAVGAFLPVVAAALLVVSIWDLGWQRDVAARFNDRPAPPPDLALSSSVTPGVLGINVWVLGLACLGIAALLGPRIVHLLPDGVTPASYGSGSAATAGHGGVLRARTQVVAVVLSAVGAALCVAGYGFLDWSSRGGSVTFSDLGEAARSGGPGGDAYAEAYFGWLGWVVLVWTVVVLVLLVLGRGSMNPVPVRPLVAIGSGLALLAHLAALVAIEDSGGVAGVAVAIGLAVSTLAALLPPRLTAQVAWSPTGS